MKLLLVGMLLFSSTNAFAWSLFSCPRILEMIDYDPAAKKPLFVEMENSSISLGAQGLDVRMANREWKNILVTLNEPDQLNPKSFYLAYVSLLFGEHLTEDDVTQIRWMTLSQGDLPVEERESIQVFEITTAEKVFRYLQFSRADLAICADPVSAH